jgi:phage tail sheath gpL-like
MPSPNISFNSIPASIRKPGQYTEFNNNLAVRTLPSNLQRVLIVAQKLAIGTATANEIVQVFDAETAATLFGRGSQAHRMVKAAIKANPYLRLFVMPIADSGTGVAATGTITVTGPATAAGYVTVNVAGTELVVPVSNADTATVVGAAIAAAINAAVDLPVTAANATGVVTLTARNKGLVGNNVKFTAVAAATGIAAVVVGFASGLNNPDLTAPLAAAQQGGHEIICVPYQVSADLTALKTHLAFVSGPMEQRRAIGVFAITSTLSTATTLAATLNGERLTGALIPGCMTPAEEVAAAYASVIASEEDPARPLNTLALTGVAPPPIASRLTRTEQESALSNGVTPLEVGPGEVVQIVRAVTTYTLNAQAVADISWLDLTTVRTMDYVAKACRERIALRFPRSKLSARTPARVRSELLDVLVKAEELEIVENVEANKDGLIVERDSVDPNRLNAKIPTDVVNGLHVFAGRLDLLL